MLVGAAREIINPELGHNLAGYSDYSANEGVHDDLSVTALYLHDGQRAAFLLNFDLIGLRGHHVDLIRNAISEKTSVLADSILLACTHTHSAPDPFESSRSGAPIPAIQVEYNKRLLQRAVSAAAAAKANAEECTLYYNYTYAAENMNRRYHFPDRRFQYIPQNKQLAGQSNEYVDRELGIIGFRKKGLQNKYKALITIYTAHPLCVGNSSLLATADYQGYLRKTVEGSFAGCLCLSLTGAAGDHHPLLPESGFSKAEKMGTNLGELAIARCYDAIHVDYDTQLRTAWREYGMPMKDAHTNDLLPEARDRERLAHLNPQGITERKLKVGLLGIGPILLAGMPGEPVAELGAMIRWSSPFLKTYPLFQSTDSAGYIVTANQYLWGGYEPATSPYAQGSGEKMVQEILATAHDLLKKQPLKYPVRGAEAIGY